MKEPPTLFYSCEDINHTDTDMDVKTSGRWSLQTSYAFGIACLDFQQVYWANSNSFLLKISVLPFFHKNLKNC